MKFPAITTALGLLAASATAIEMDVREESGGDWILVPVEDGVCKTYDNPVVQINLVPWSNGGSSFICRPYVLSNCQGDFQGSIASNHPLTGEFQPPVNSVLCFSACCWG
ncbi:hypothetical protein BJY01DRAFT_251724 [Aspergillus pseudoustus]|uniref:Uncharacterized protein n=1 Tax=Aspergillus pseudoustus TaxID=1810923 RepID=A0ABR4JA47_9EURO